MNKLTAVIIKGNPKFVKGNQAANSFYEEINIYLESLGYEVSFDLGEPHTLSKKASLWLGHSRGVSRLAFAPEETKIIALGSVRKDAINHPEDNTKDIIGESDILPNKYHYVFTEEMKKAIKKITDSIKG